MLHLNLLRIILYFHWVCRESSKHHNKDLFLITSIFPDPGELFRENRSTHIQKTSRWPSTQTLEPIVSLPMAQISDLQRVGSGRSKVEHVLIAAAELIKGRCFKDKLRSRECPLTVGTVVSDQEKKHLCSPLLSPPSLSFLLCLSPRITDTSVT